MLSFYRSLLRQFLPSQKDFTMIRYSLLLPICATLTACATRPLPDISHAKVWHAENGYVRATTGEVPVYSPNQATQIITPIQYNTPTSPTHFTPAQSPTTYTAQPASVIQNKQPQPASITTRYPVIVDQNTLHDPSTLPQSFITTKQSPISSIFNHQFPNDFSSIIMQAENQSSGLVRHVLAQSRAMTLRKEIVKGGCWDYLDTAWSRAGVSRDMRQTVYKSKKESGNYADINYLRAGDWIYHINHSYHDTEHSGMFIGWVDKSRHLGLTLSYAGEGRKESARYKIYDLSSVYNIMRAPS